MDQRADPPSIAGGTMGKARQLAEEGVQLFNAGDIDGLAARCATDAIEITPMGEAHGPAAIAERLRRDRAAFPDLHIEPLGWVEGGDTVVVEYTWTGTNTGTFPLPDGSALPPTGEKLTITGVSVFEYRGEEMVAHRTYFDQLPAMVQLGVVAPVQQSTSESGG